MLSIGEFSKICRVSTKTLRYYNEIGLVFPDEVNEESGYRYYSVEQLRKMLFINRLKSYCFSLEEIKKIHEGEKSDEKDKKLLYTALFHKKNELLEKMKNFNRILWEIECDLKNLEKGVSIMKDFDNVDIELVENEQSNILFIRKKVTQEECDAGYGMFFKNLNQKILSEKLTVAGAPMTIYHSSEYDFDGYDMEFAIPVKESVAGTRIFQRGLCLKSILKGNYSKLISVYARQQEWIAENGYEVVNSLFEVYITDPDTVSSPDENITEIYYPIKKI